MAEGENHVPVSDEVPADGKVDLDDVDHQNHLNDLSIMVALAVQSLLMGAKFDKKGLAAFLNVPIKVAQHNHMLRMTKEDDK